MSETDTSLAVVGLGRIGFAMGGLRLSEKEAAKLFGGNPKSGHRRPRRRADSMLPTSVTRAPRGAREFVILGRPIPKPRQTQKDKWLGRKGTSVRPEVAAYRAWAAIAQNSAPVDLIHLPPGVPLTLSATFYLPMPTGWSNEQRVANAGQPHLGRPDLDNLLKALTDSLWPEADSFVWRFETCEKRYADGAGARTIVRWDKENNNERTRTQRLR